MQKSLLSNKERSLILTKKHIHIMGASGSGTTILARELSRYISYKHLDSDDFFWKVKYTESNTRDVRLQNLKKELIDNDKWILSGAVIDWGNPLIP